MTRDKASGQTNSMKWRRGRSIGNFRLHNDKGKEGLSALGALRLIGFVATSLWLSQNLYGKYRRPGCGELG